jgi:hypothetical protein
MSSSTAQRLRDLFTADAAAAPDVVDLAAGVRHRVRRRRRMLAAWSSGVGTAVVLVAVGAFGAHGPVRPPQAQSPSVAAVTPSPTRQVFTAERYDRVVPGGPLVDAGMAMASCATEYTPAKLAELPIVFDGTVMTIGPGRTNRRPATGVSSLRAVTFRVHEWFRGGPGNTVVVDLPQPNGTGPRFDQSMRSYGIGTRLLVPGISHLGGVPQQYPIAARCGFTRYYSPERAAEWAAATR